MAANSANPASKELSALFNKSKIKFNDIAPPIEDEILDPKDLINTFTKLPLIPYSGIENTTSHRLVNLLYRFKTMSTTYSGILNDFKSYALKGKIDIVTHGDTFFDTGDDKEVDDASKKAYDSIIRENFLFEDKSPKNLACLMSDSWHPVGQYLIVVTTKKVLGKFIICVKFYPPTQYCFTRNEGVGNGNEVAISKKWDYDYVRRNPPKLIPIYPFEYSYNDGTTSTAFFEKNGGELYGRPEDLSAMHAKYNEYKLEQFLTKKNKKLWMPDAFIEFEDAEQTNVMFDDDAAQEAGAKDAIDMFERNFTNAGEDTRAAIVTNRPFGASQTFIHEFKGLSNGREVDIYQKIFQNKILEANSWTSTLLSMGGVTGLNSNTFLDIFSIKSVTKIEEIQVMASTGVNNVLQYGLGKLGIKSELGIKFSSPLKDLLNEYNQSKRSNPVVSSEPGSKQQTEASM